LIVFGYKDTNNFYWWNIGGWGNTQYAIEQNVDGNKTVLTSVAGSVNTNQWYDIRIEVSKTKTLFYLDNILIHTLDNSSSQMLFTSATLDETNNQLYLKVINPSNKDVITNLNFNGIPDGLISGKSTVLTSANALNENSLDNKTNIVPVETVLNSIPKASNYTFKANSFTVLQLNASSINEIPFVKKNDKGIQIYPNPTHDYISVKGSGDGFITLKISSLVGQTMINKTIQNGSNIDLSTLVKGIYILETKQGNTLVATKLVKN
jgi:hypothetical protein